MIKQTRKIISEIGCKTMKHFYESFDCNNRIIYENGELYRFKYKGERDFLTPIGIVRINRNVYQKDIGGKSIIPLDRKWKMENQYMSEEVRESLLFSCAYNTPEETSRLFEKIGDLNIHPTTIKTLVDDTGNFIEEYKDTIKENIHSHEQFADTPDVMVCSFDGVNVLLNEKGKKKGRPKERPTKKITDQTNSAYKNAMCGTVSFYNIEKDEKTERKTACRKMTKYVSRMPEDKYISFKHEFEKEIEHCNKAKPIIKILLTDGHKSIQGYLKNNPKYSDYTWMFDFFHAAEHLSKLSEFLFGKSSDKGQEWYTKRRNDLKYKENGVGKVIRSAEYYIKKLKGKNRKKSAKKELNYFKNHRKRMNYNLHIDKGWPIGSGVVEAACKSVVKQRMCRSGQRWTREGGQKILWLRTFVKSKRWDQFWEEYTKTKYKKCA